MASWHVWTGVALLSWGIWAVLSKVLGDVLTAEQSQAISTLGLIPILVVLAFPVYRRGELRNGSPRGILLTFIGGVVSCLGNLTYYGALARGEKVATVVSLTALYPLTTILLAVTFLRERLNRIQLAGIVLSFVAIWLFNIQGDGGLFSRTVAYAIAPILLWGLSGFLQKVATNLLPTDAAALIYLGAFVPVGLYLGLRHPWPTTLTPRVWMVVLALGFFLAFGNYALLAAYARGGKAAVLAPLTGLYPVISVPLAVLLLGEKVGQREIIGIALALTSVVALSIESPPTNAPGTPERVPPAPANRKSQI
jgi:transporter family protein